MFSFRLISWTSSSAEPGHTLCRIRKAHRASDANVIATYCDNPSYIDLWIRAEPTPVVVRRDVRLYYELNRH